MVVDVKVVEVRIRESIEGDWENPDPFALIAELDEASTFVRLLTKKYADISRMKINDIHPLSVLLDGEMYRFVNRKKMVFTFDCRNLLLVRSFLGFHRCCLS